MTADRKAAMEWASNGYHTHGEDCPECNLAACYLEVCAELEAEKVENAVLREQNFAMNKTIAELK